MTIAEAVAAQTGYAFFLEDPLPEHEVKREFDELLAARRYGLEDQQTSVS